MRNDLDKERYEQGKKKAEEGKIPLLVHISALPYAVGTELSLEGIRDLPYDSFLSIYRWVVGKVAASLDVNETLSRFSRALNSPDVRLNPSLRSEIYLGRDLYIQRVKGLFSEGGAPTKYLPRKLLKRDRLEIVSEMCCVEKPDIFKNYSGALQLQKKTDLMDTDTIIIAKFNFAPWDTGVNV